MTEQEFLKKVKFKSRASDFPLPALFVSEAARAFVAACQYPLRTSIDQDFLRGKNTLWPVVFNARWDFTPRFQSEFLKFLEEFESIIILSYSDQILPTIASRMKAVYKRSFKVPERTIKTYISVDEDLHQESKITEMLLNPVQAYYYVTTIAPNKEKWISFLMGSGSVE